MDKKKKKIIIGSVSVGVVLLSAFLSALFIFVLPIVSAGKELKAAHDKNSMGGISEETGTYSYEDETATPGQNEDPSFTDSTGTGDTSGSGFSEVSDTEGNTDGTTSGGVSPTQPQQTTNSPSQPASSNVHSGTTKPTQQTTKPSQPPTTKPSQQPTTKPTQPHTTQPPTTQPQAKSEYDIYRSGTFYIKGNATDENGVQQPMELAMTPNTVYMVTQLDGAEVGVMITEKKTYMVYSNAKIYCELSSVLMKAVDLDIETVKAEAQKGYTKLPPLSKTTPVGTKNVNGYNCTQYKFPSEDGGWNIVSISGNKLVQCQGFNADGSIFNTVNFTTVTANVPKDKMSPPSNFNKVNMISFMAELSKVIEV